MLLRVSDSRGTAAFRTRTGVRQCSGAWTLYSLRLVLVILVHGKDTVFSEAEPIDGNVDRTFHGLQALRRVPRLRETHKT